MLVWIHLPHGYPWIFSNTRLLFLHYSKPFQWNYFLWKHRFEGLMKTMGSRSHYWIIKYIDTSLASIFWMKKLFRVLLFTVFFIVRLMFFELFRYSMTLFVSSPNFLYKLLKNFMLQWNREAVSSAMERASEKSYLQRTRRVSALLSDPNFSSISKKSALSFPSGYNVWHCRSVSFSLLFPWFCSLDLDSYHRISTAFSMIKQNDLERKKIRCVDILTVDVSNDFGWW